MANVARRYQIDMHSEVVAAHDNGYNNVGAVLPTGGGKTFIMGSLIKAYDVPTIAGAHRNELVGQISIALAREEIRHDIIAPTKIVKQIVGAHMDEFGMSYYSPRAHVKTGGVKTLLKMATTESWFKTVGFGVMDEAHHVLRDNEWGRGVAMFPNAKWFLPTATPTRADRKGLGRTTDGLMDILVEGPPMRWLIDNGYLTDYRVMCPTPDDLDLSDVSVSANGDFNREQLSKAIRRSTKIVGSVVDTYIAKCRDVGKWLLGVTFAVDITEAQKITDEFNARGVPAALITGEDDPDTRRKKLKMFRERKYLQLVNVDLFGEGFDLPAIEYVAFARPTASFALYAQQWGRALRLLISPILMAAWDTYTSFQRLAFIASSEKPVAWIADHVGNLMRHEGPPDKPRVWSLDRPAKRKSGGGDGIPLRVCGNVTCNQPYERTLSECPFCEEKAPPPRDRSSPAFVDGNLLELSPEVLAEMRRDVGNIDRVAYAPNGVTGMAAVVIVKRHQERQRSQAWLRSAIAHWAGAHHRYSDEENYKRFYFTFGIDVLSACALNVADADKLREKIAGKLALDGIVINDYGSMAH